MNKLFIISLSALMFSMSTLSEEIKLHDYLKPTKSDLRKLKNISRKNGVAFCNSITESLLKLYYEHRVHRRPRCSENKFLRAPFKTGSGPRKPRPFSDSSKKDDIEYQRGCVKRYIKATQNLEEFKRFCINATKGTFAPRWGKREFSGMLKEKKQRKRFLSKEGLR